jgi:hypothetical protein
MMKLITSGMFVVGMASVPVALSPRPVPAQIPIPAPEYRNDPRLETLRNFFHNSDCPAEQWSADFLAAADYNDLDWRLLPSLSYIESTGGKTARFNNLFGWDSGKAQFSTPVEGIHTVGYRLSHSDLYRHKELDKILATYNSDADYGRKVKSVMRRIAPTE